MLRPELCGGAGGIAIPQGQQRLVASHQGLAKPSRSAPWRPGAPGGKQPRGMVFLNELIHPQ